MADTTLYPLDLSVPSKVAFYRALSAINSKALAITESDVQVLSIQDDSSHVGANTHCVLQPVAGSAVVMGPKEDYWYTRYSLADVLSFQGYHDNHVVVNNAVAEDWDESKSAAAALAAFNAVGKSTVPLVDVTWIELDRTDTQVVGTLTMIDGDLVLFGEAQVTANFA